MTSTQKATARFHRKYRKREWGCWLWNAAAHDAGYGRVRWEGKIRSATHVMWLLEHGDYPPGNMFVLHRCDEPSCVNPEHLYLGTQADNMKDRIERNRVPRREPTSLQQAKEWLHLYRTQQERIIRRILILQEWMADHPEGQSTLGR